MGALRNMILFLYPCLSLLHFHHKKNMPWVSVGPKRMKICEAELDSTQNLGSSRAEPNLGQPKSRWFTDTKLRKKCLLFYALLYCGYYHAALSRYLMPRLNKLNCILNFYDNLSQSTGNGYIWFFFFYVSLGNSTHYRKYHLTEGGPSPTTLTLNGNAKLAPFTFLFGKHELRLPH